MSRMKMQKDGLKYLHYVAEEDTENVYEVFAHKQ